MLISLTTPYIYREIFYVYTLVIRYILSLLSIPSFSLSLQRFQHKNDNFTMPWKEDNHTSFKSHSFKMKRMPQTLVKCSKCSRQPCLVVCGWRLSGVTWGGMGQHLWFGGSDRRLSREVRRLSSPRLPPSRLSPRDLSVRIIAF